MKTYIHTFSTSEALGVFLQSVEKSQKNTIFISYFSGVLDVNYNKKIINQLLESLPMAVLVGCTSCNQITNEHILNDSIVITFMFFENTTITYYINQNSLSSQNLGENLGKIAHYSQIQLALLLCNSYIKGEELICGFASAAPGVIFTGGVLEDKHLLFVNEKIYSDSTVVVFFKGDTLRVLTNEINNWIGIGPQMTITKSIGRRVYLINDEPVKNLYERYLGAEIVNSKDSTAIEFPLIYSNGEYKIIRVPMQIYDDGSILFSGDFMDGTPVQFAFCNVGGVLEQSNSIFQEITSFEPELIFVFSCITRKPFLGNFQDIETKHLSLIAPIAGFFTKGNFFHELSTREKLFLHNTFSLSLSEKPIIKKLPIENDRNEKILFQSFPFLYTNKVFYNLLKATSEELNDIKNDIELSINNGKKKREEKEKVFYAKSRLTTMGEMTFMLAHQWRQPLMAINAITTLIKLKVASHISNKYNIDECISDLEKNVYSLSNIIDQFSYISHISNRPINTSLTEIAQIIKNNFFDYLLVSGIKLSFVIAHDTDLYIYKNELIQVLMVIIQNAKDVLIERNIMNGEIVICFDVFHKPNYCSITVQDNGGGVINENIDKIFNPYFTTKNNINGSGLGLFIAKTIVERQLIGEITVENNYDGAYFRIEFPVSVKIHSQAEPCILD